VKSFVEPQSKRTRTRSNTPSWWRTFGASRCASSLCSQSFAFGNHLFRRSRRLPVISLKSGCRVGSISVPTAAMLSTFSPLFDRRMIPRAAVVITIEARGMRFSRLTESAFSA
jgi:hypothetical protein